MKLNMEYLIHVAGPLHIGTGIGFARMVDDTVVRASIRGDLPGELPCIPGSSIKGRVRSRCQRLANVLGLTVCASGPGTEERVCKTNPCIQCRLFGSAYFPGGLRFSDALPTNDWRHVARPYTERTSNSHQDRFSLGLVRAGNKLERATRTMERDFLFSLEHTADGLVFAGAVSGSVDLARSSGSAALLPPEGWALITGFQMVDKLGGLKSRGLGRCKVEITRLNVDDVDFTGEDLVLLINDSDRLSELKNYDSIRVESNTAKPTASV